MPLLDQTEESSLLLLMDLMDKKVSIIPPTIKLWPKRDSHSPLITILTTLPTLETSVVSHKTGTSNTAREKFNQELQKNLNLNLDGPLNTSTLERLPHQLKDMILLAKLLTLNKTNQLLTSQMLPHGLMEFIQLLSQLRTSLVDIPETLELSEEENTYSLLFPAMVQDSKLTETEFSITGVNTD